MKARGTNNKTILAGLEPAREKGQNRVATGYQGLAYVMSIE